MVLDNPGQHASRWQAIQSVSAKFGCAADTLNERVKKAEVTAHADALETLGDRLCGDTLDTEATDIVRRLIERVAVEDYQRRRRL